MEWKAFIHGFPSCNAYIRDSIAQVTERSTTNSSERNLFRSERNLFLSERNLSTKISPAEIDITPKRNTSNMMRLITWLLEIAKILICSENYQELMSGKFSATSETFLCGVWKFRSWNMLLSTLLTSNTISFTVHVISPPSFITIMATSQYSIYIIGFWQVRFTQGGFRVFGPDFFLNLEKYLLML